MNNNLEEHLKNDFEAFLEYHEDQIRDAQETTIVLKKLFEQFGHSFDIKELLDLSGGLDGS